MNKEFFREVREAFHRYREYKQELDMRILENNRWLKEQTAFSEHGDETTRPATAFVFNAIANKHADAMDNYPEPNILARCQEDEGQAQLLSKMIPTQLEASGFKRTYSRAWWYKLKHGAALYGVFFEPSENHGMGDICIRQLNLLHVFWEPGIEDIQDSKFLFLTSMEHVDTLRERYPGKEIHPYEEPEGAWRWRTTWEKEPDMAQVVDCYYKKDGALHLLTYCGNEVLDSSEDRGMEGIYQHGKYPVVADVLFPQEDSPVGLGMIDVMKNPQEYINKLDGIISKNALISGKVRFLIKDSGGVNEQEFLDMSQDVIHVAGSVSEDNIRQFQAAPLDGYIISHRQNKIAEMKEIAGNRDFQQGGTSNGVTAYSAISALQQAGEKLSRDMIAETYEAYKEIVYLCIELVREFFDEPRFYRYTKTDGQAEYIAYSNEGLKERRIEDTVLEEEIYRRPEFDIEVSVQRNSPYNKITQNQLATGLYQMGVFHPDAAEQALMLLELMQFDGKAKVMEYIRKNKEERRDSNGRHILQNEGDRQTGGNAP
jgi:hypothetical protein|nr:MAG TPA: portal protein [Caudoviricetes sp.]